MILLTEQRPSLFVFSSQLPHGQCCTELQLTCTWEELKPCRSHSSWFWVTASIELLSRTMEIKKQTLSDSHFRIRLTIAGASLEAEPSSLGPGLQGHIEVETICLVEPFVYSAIWNGYILSTTMSMWNIAAQAFSVVESTVRIALSSACSRISNRYRIFEISGEDYTITFFKINVTSVPTQTFDLLGRKDLWIKYISALCTESYRPRYTVPSHSFSRRHTMLSNNEDHWHY